MYTRKSMHNLVHRLDHLAEYADGLVTCVEEDVASSSNFCLQRCTARNCCCSENWVCRSRINFGNLQRFAVPASLGILLLQVVDIPNLLRTWTDEDPISCMIPEECGVLEVWLVASMGFVGHRQIVHHGHEDDSVACACLAYLFQQSHA